MTLLNSPSKEGPGIQDTDLCSTDRQVLGKSAHTLGSPQENEIIVYPHIFLCRQRLEFLPMKSEQQASNAML